MHATKQRSGWKARSFAIGAFAFVVLACWVGWSLGSECVTGAGSPASVTFAPIVQARDEHSQAQIDNAGIRPTPNITEASRQPVAMTAPFMLAPGILALRAVDHSALGPLRWFAVSIASASRYASEHGLGGVDLELPLTAGTYTVVVWAPGHEATELANVELTSGACTRIPLIELRPGSGRIHGQVIGNVSPEVRFNVELRGEGRHPCERCCGVDPKESNGMLMRPPCGECGFARNASILSVRAGDPFEFRNLASGNYVIRLSDGDLTIGAPTEVTLAPNAVASVVLEASATRAVDVEMFDTNGVSLAEVWARRLQTNTPTPGTDDEQPQLGTETMRIVFSADGAKVAHATFIPPEIVRQKSTDPGEIAREKFEAGLREAMMEDMMSRLNSDAALIDEIAKRTATRERRIVDRPRAAADRFPPASDKPQFQLSAAINCTMARDGVLSVGPVPTRPLHIQVSTAHTSVETDVAESRDSTLVRMRLRAQ
jgi:hypothetical protein